MSSTYVQLDRPSYSLFFSLCRLSMLCSELSPAILTVLLGVIYDTWSLLAVRYIFTHSVVSWYVMSFVFSSRSFSVCFVIHPFQFLTITALSLWYFALVSAVSVRMSSITIPVFLRWFIKLPFGYSSSWISYVCFIYLLYKTETPPLPALCLDVKGPLERWSNETEWQQYNHSF